MSRILLLLCFLPSLAAAAPAAVSGGKTGAMLSSAPASTAPSTSTGRGGGGGGGRERIDPRHVPPLDPERKVSEQDCTKPVDLTRGNLKCK
jgi:hypothetical protein